MRGIETLMRNASRFHRSLQRLECRIRNWRHQQRIGASEKSPHRSFAWSITRGNAAHIHGVGDDQAFKMQFIAQKSG